MNTSFWKPILTTFCTAALSTGAFGAPLQRADVAAQPSWLVHVDCDSLRSAAIGQFLQSQLAKPEVQARLAAFQALFSFDLRTQLHGLTLYSSGTTASDGVLLVYADFDPERLVTLANAAKDPQNSTHKQHVIYNWVDEKKKARDGVKPRVYAAMLGSRVIFGQREEQVAAALDVLDGAAPNLAGGKTFPQLGAAGDTSFIEAAARKLEMAGSDPHAAILKLSKSVLLQVGEVQGQVKAMLTLEANSPEVAGSIASIAQGLISLGKLQEDKPESAKLAQALSLKQDGAQILISLALPSDQAVDILKAGEARKAGKRAQ